VVVTRKSPEGRCGWEPLYSIVLAMEHEFTNRPFQNHSWIGQKRTTFFFFFFWLALVSGWNQDLGLVLLYLLNAGKLIGCKNRKETASLTSKQRPKMAIPVNSHPIDLVCYNNVKGRKVPLLFRNTRHPTTLKIRLYQQHQLQTAHQII
jgi:hypothetical protein